MCKGFCRIFNISLHRIAYFSLVSSDVSSDCEQTTKNRRTYRKPKILIRYQVKFLVFYMFSGFLLFSHNLDLYFLNKISFSGTLAFLYSTSNHLKILCIFSYFHSTLRPDLNSKLGSVKKTTEAVT